jgi:hypothetical protein
MYEINFNSTTINQQLFILLKIYINGKLVTKNFVNDSSESYVGADKIV